MGEKHEGSSTEMMSMVTKRADQSFQIIALGQVLVGEAAAEGGVSGGG
jgi:hypothetical protein